MPDCSDRCAVSGQIAEEGRVLLHFFLLGVGITFFYDLFRIFRRVVRHGTLWISLEDLLFWILVSVGVFSFFYYENNGAFRWFAVFGAGVGMFLYKRTLSEPFVALGAGILNAGFALIRKILWKLSAPLRFLWKKIRIWSGRAARRAGRELRIRRRSIKRRLTAWIKTGKIKLYRFRQKWKKAEEN